jgi:hypothetical protein
MLCDIFSTKLKNQQTEKPPTEWLHQWQSPRCSWKIYGEHLTGTRTSEKKGSHSLPMPQAIWKKKKPTNRLHASWHTKSNGQ